MFILEKRFHFLTFMIDYMTWKIFMCQNADGYEKTSTLTCAKMQTLQVATSDFKF